MKNILGILGAVSFVISGSLLGATVFSVMWLKNPENQEKIKSKVVDSVMKSISLPSLSGPPIPTLKPQSSIKKDSSSVFKGAFKTEFDKPF